MIDFIRFLCTCQFSLDMFNYLAQTKFDWLNDWILGLDGMLMLFFLCFCLSSVTVVLFCMAALIFPIGFYINEVGGQPYKLPNNTVVGSSYVLFVLSIFFTIVGLLFAGKVCLPGWHILLLVLLLFCFGETPPLGGNGFRLDPSMAVLEVSSE